MDERFAAGELRQMQLEYASWVPRVRAYARKFFWSEQDKERLEEMLADVVAMGWKRFLDFHAQHGSHPTAFGWFVTDLCRRVWQGYRVQGACPVTDVCSGRVSRRKVRPYGPRTRLRVRQLGDQGGELRARSDGDLARQACFNLDWQAWVRRQSVRDQALMIALAMGEQVKTAALAAGLAEATLHRLRAKWREDWQSCHSGNGV